MSSEFTSNKPSAHDRQIIGQSYSKNIPKARRKKELFSLGFMHVTAQHFNV
jgi:hypothetical protein